MNLSSFDTDRIKLIPHFDKIVHFLMYFTLSFVFMFEYYIHHHKTIKTISKILVLPLFYGALMEFMQYLLTSYRGADWKDMIANTMGIVIAYFAVRLLRNNTFVKKWMLFPLKQPLFKA